MQILETSTEVETDRSSLGAESGKETLERFFATEPQPPRKISRTQIGLIVAAVFGVSLAAILAPDLTSTSDDQAVTMAERQSTPPSLSPVDPGESYALAEPPIAPIASDLGEAAPALPLPASDAPSIAGENTSQPASPEANAALPTGPIPPTQPAAGPASNSGAVSAAPEGIAAAPAATTQQVASAAAVANARQATEGPQEIRQTQPASPASLANVVAAPAQRQAGAITHSDYPRSAIREKGEGAVAVRYTVQADGSVGGCTVIKSSGRNDLDRSTCRLIEQRFRYTPARDANGAPVQQTMTGWYDWFLKRRR